MTHALCAPYASLTCPLLTPYVPLTCPLLTPYVPLTCPYVPLTHLLLVSGDGPHHSKSDY